MLAVFGRKLRLSHRNAHRLQLLATLAKWVVIVAAFCLVTVWRHAKGVAHYCDYRSPYYGDTLSSSCQSIKTFPERLYWINWVNSGMVATFVVSFAVLIVTAMCYALFARGSKVAYDKKDRYLFAISVATAITVITFIMLSGPAVWIAVFGD